MYCKRVSGCHDECFTAKFTQKSEQTMPESWVFGVISTFYSSGYKNTKKSVEKIIFFIWYGCCIDIDAHLYNRNKEREKQVNIVISIWMIRQSRIHVYSKGGKNAIMNQNQNHLSHRNKITISSLCVQPATNTENNILWYTINKFVDLCAQTEKQRFIHEICDFLFLFIMNEWIRNQTLKCLYLLLLNGNRTNYWWSRSW